MQIRFGEGLASETGVEGGNGRRGIRRPSEDGRLQRLRLGTLAAIC
jgi:hypothetical protein